MRRHRSTNVLLLLAIAVATSAAPRASAAWSRGISLEYTGPAAGISTPRASYLHDECTEARRAPGCVVTRIRRGDRFVAVEVRDEAGGRLVGASVWVESSDGDFDLLGVVCGDSMEVPLAIPRGYEYLEVHVQAGTCSGSTTPSIATRGVVDLWFSARRFG